MTAADWTSFYEAVCANAGEILSGLDDDDREIISLAAGTDAFWSEGMEELLKMGAASGDIRRGVLDALDQWRDSVIEVLMGDFGLDLDGSSIMVDREAPVMELLVEAATA